MFGFSKKKKKEEKPSPLSFFKVNHPLDIVYEQDINGIRTRDPKVQAELNQLADLACMGASLAKVQAITIRAQVKDPFDLFVLGYVFGCLDVYKTQLWGVQDFNRSFFHCGFYSYFGSWNAANDALINLSKAINSNEPEFMRAAKIGSSDTFNMIQEKKIPNGLIEYLLKEG